MNLKKSQDERGKVNKSGLGDINTLPHIERVSNKNSAKLFFLLVVFSYLASVATNSFALYCLILATYTVIALRLNNSQNLSFILITVTLVPTNFLPLFNSELLRQLSPANIIAVVFVAKNLESKKLRLYGWLAFVCLVLAINLTATIDWRWSISMSSRIIFLTLCLVMSTDDIQKINWKLQIDTIVKLLSILVPLGMIEAFTSSRPLFNGSFGLPIFVSVDSASNNGRSLLTFGQANVAAMVLATYYIVILFDYLFLKNRSYLNYSLLFLTGVVLVSTGSRSGTFAIFLGTIWVVIMRITNGKPVGVFLILIPTSYLVLASILYNLFAKFSSFGFGRDSIEAKMNWELRKTILTNKQVFESLPFLGVGNGNAQKYYALNGYGSILENSAYQILIGFGIFLGVLLILIWLFLLMSSVSMPSISFYIPTLFFLISSNAWEGTRFIQIFLGVITCMARALDQRDSTC